MVQQRSFSPCFFGNKVTMAFKLIFVFAIIATFAVDAMKMKQTSGTGLATRNFKLIRGTLEGDYKVIKKKIEPTGYVMIRNGKRIQGQLRGCNGLKRWIKGANCSPGNWRKFTISGFKDGEFTLCLNGKNRFQACFENDD